jgi:hypothetical protein
MTKKYLMAVGFGAAIMLTLMLVINARSDSGPSVTGQDTVQSSSPVVHTPACIVKLPSTLDFAGEPVPLHLPDVAERLDRELHINVYWHSSTIQILKLANRWLPLLEGLLATQGIPDDFKYLCVAESGLRNLVSPAGATGFWQFLNATAKQYGLEISAEVDERYDVGLSTLAACKFLADAHSRYGSWTMAGASYNAGTTGISTDMNNQSVTSYYDLLLNDETSRYIFRILAFKLILSDPDKYGFCFDEDDLYAPLETEKYVVKESIPNLAAFALEHQTNLKTLKYYNPWLRSNTLTIKGRAYELLLPKGS